MSEGTKSAQPATPFGDWGIQPRYLELAPNAIREILKVASQPGMISFAGGLPAPELFPIDDLKTAAETALAKHGAAALQYSITRGILPLREVIAHQECADGSPTKVENVMITTGAQQGLDLLARLFIQPGDYIITERPTYVGAIHTFNTYGVKYIDLPMDEHGLLPDELESAITKYRPKFIYVIPSFQNPTGITLAKERRYRLVEIAAKHNVPLLDDDPYIKLRFEGEDLPTLKSIGGDSVIALRTFSKTVTPGLRMGWINASDSFLGQLEKVKQATDLHTPSLNQFIILEYIRAGKLEPHIQKICTDYRAKRDLMLSEMAKQFPKAVTWTTPQGGMFLWVELPKQMSTTELLKQAVEMQIVYVPGGPFFPNGGNDHCLRLNYSNASRENIVEGIKRLDKLLKSVIL